MFGLPISFGEFGGAIIRIPQDHFAMMYAVLFEDNLQLGTEVRQKHMPQHLAFLERNAACITAAGPLCAPQPTIRLAACGSSKQRMQMLSTRWSKTTRSGPQDCASRSAF